MKDFMQRLKCKSQRKAEEDMGTTEKFGDLIRARRRTLKKTLQDLADVVGVSVAYYSEVELGKRPPFKSERIAALAEALKISYEDLFASAWASKRVISFDTQDIGETTASILHSLARGGIDDERLKRIEKLLKED